LPRPDKDETKTGVLRNVLLLACAALLTPLFAQAQDRPEPPTEPRSTGRLSFADAIILGVVEGVTEFLPISSTGHLIIATRLLELESEEPLLDPAGQPLWHTAPSPENPQGVPLTLKLAADTFNVVMQIGAIAAVALLYWTQCLAMFRGVFGRDPGGRRLFINVVVAFLPAAVIGLLFHDLIETHLFSVETVIVALVVGAGLMFFAEWWRRRGAMTGRSEKQSLAELTPAAAAGIGFMQILALWPGMSRSMTTIVGGYFVGLDPRRAAEFSFLLGLVTLGAASAYKGVTSGSAMFQVLGVPQVLLGTLVAAVTAAVCVRFLVHWLTRHGLGVFAWYRLVIAAALAAVFYL